jgi:hypothetical protein
LQLKWKDYQASQEAEIRKVAEEAKMLKEGQVAMKQLEAKQEAERLRE